MELVLKKRTRKWKLEIEGDKKEEEERQKEIREAKIVRNDNESSGGLMFYIKKKIVSISSEINHFVFLDIIE